MYWHALAMLTDGQTLSDDYFQRCVGQLGAVWHGQQAEEGLPDRIIEAIRDNSHAGTSC